MFITSLLVLYEYIIRELSTARSLINHNELFIIDTIYEVHNVFIIDTSFRIGSEVWVAVQLGQVGLEHMGNTIVNTWAVTLLTNLLPIIFS